MHCKEENEESLSRSKQAKQSIISTGSAQLARIYCASCVYIFIYVYKLSL